MAMSTKQRKAAGSFVSDPSAMNLMDLTPRTELYHNERSPYTMASHSSKTNFIGESVIAEGPRAVAVSETGEKHSIHLDDDSIKTTATINLNTNPFTNTCPSHLPTVPSEQTLDTLTKMPNANGSNERQGHNSAKRSKSSRRYINQKPRPVFTPRNLAKLTPRSTYEECSQSKVPNQTAQTQTDVYTAKSSRVFQPLAPSPPPVQITRKCPRESVGDMLDIQRRQPLRILPRKKAATMKNYAELRNIASALTLITVVSWLFSTFFELEGLIEMFAGLAQTFSGWYEQRKQPMTKAEMLVQYLRDLWP